MWKISNNNEIHDGLDQAVCSTELFRISSAGLSEKLSDKVVAEQAITIMIDKVGSFTIMATPADIEALAVGFVYFEGLIASMDDVIAVSTNPHLPNVVGITVQDPTQIAIGRNMIMASSCGMCGTRNIEKMLSDIPACDQSLEVSSNILIEVAEQLHSMQKVFQLTGGSHAAGIFDFLGKITTFAEDIGRHTALDKAIGKCLIAGQSLKGCGVVLSGRASLEMVAKAARAGIELVSAVSAASSFAVEAAERWNITLCGFVRPDKINVYTHPQRICNLERLTK